MGRRLLSGIIFRMLTSLQHFGQQRKLLADLASIGAMRIGMMKGTVILPMLSFYTSRHILRCCRKNHYDICFNRLHCLFHLYHGGILSVSATFPMGASIAWELLFL